MWITANEQKRDMLGTLSMHGTYWQSSSELLSSPGQIFVFLAHNVPVRDEPWVEVKENRKEFKRMLITTICQNIFTNLVSCCVILQFSYFQVWRKTEKNTLILTLPRPTYLPHFRFNRSHRLVLEGMDSALWDSWVEHFARSSGQLRERNTSDPQLLRRLS